MDPKEPPGLGDVWLLGHGAAGRGSGSSAEPDGMWGPGWEEEDHDPAAGSLGAGWAAVPSRFFPGC